MAFSWNIFRILADVSHASSKGILIWAIHSNQSAEGVSFITQLAYLAVFVARYVPTSWFPSGQSSWHIIWNVSLKIFYILSSIYILFVMSRVYARTQEREMATKIGAISAAASLCLAPFVMMIFTAKQSWSFSEFTWTFSIIEESVCVLPQLLLLRQTTVPTVIDSFYLVTLGSYRGFYLLNWLVTAIHKDNGWDPISVIFGLIQTALYIDFGWVYWTRQRVKLRGGAVVDSEDLSKGWLVKRLIGDRDRSANDEEGGAAAGGQQSGRWGARGISVSADDGVHDIQSHNELADPNHFEDGDSDDETSRQQNKAAAPKAYADEDASAVNGPASGVSDGSEWRANK